MGATQGRPYCLKAMCYILKESQSPAKLTKTCSNCGHIIYVGCKGFIGRGRIGEREVFDWIRWWYHNIPIPTREEPEVHCLESKANLEESK